MAELPEGIRSHVVWVPLLWPARSAPCFMSKSSGLTTQPHSDGIGVEDGKVSSAVGTRKVANDRMAGCGWLRTRLLAVDGEQSPLWQLVVRGHWMPTANCFLSLGLSSAFTLLCCPRELWFPSAVCRAGV